MINKTHSSGYFGAEKRNYLYSSHVKYTSLDFVPKIWKKSSF